MLETNLNKNYHLYVLILIVVAAAVLRVYMSFFNMDALMGIALVQDDAYYYYEIAKNILLNGVPSFDGINQTNGFHPLWQIVCLPVMYMFEGESAVRVMLLIASLLDLISILLLYRLVLSLSKDTTMALLAVFVFAFHGHLVRTHFNGLETSINTLMLLMFSNLYVGLRDKQLFFVKQHCLLALVAAMAFLSRTDSAIYIMVACLFLYYPYFEKEKFVAGASFSLVVMIVISPWLLWNYQNFGSLVQESGKIHGALYFQYLEIEDKPFYLDFIAAFFNSYADFGVVMKKLLLFKNAPIALGYFLFLMVFVALYLVSKRSREFKLSVRLIFPIALGVFVMFFYHSGFRGFIRGWYHAPVWTMMVVLLALLLNELCNRVGVKCSKLWISVVMGLLVLVFVSPADYLFKRKFNTTDARILASDWLDTHTEDDAIIGSANAGVIGYYTEKPVVNLDGVVNGKALEARVNFRFSEYLLDENISYIVDHVNSIDKLCAPNEKPILFQCDELKRWGNNIVIAKVKKL